MTIKKCNDRHSSFVPMNLRYHLSKKKKDTQRWPRLLPVLKQAARLELDRPWTFCDEVLHVKVFRGGTK